MMDVLNLGFASFLAYVVEHGALLLCIAGCSLVTVIPRTLPLMYLSTDALPPCVMRWLSFVPVAVLSALIGPDVLLHEGALDISVNNLYLMVALPALGVAWWTKSFFGTILFSMGALALLRYVVA